MLLLYTHIDHLPVQAGNRRGKPTATLPKNTFFAASLFSIR